MFSMFFVSFSFLLLSWRIDVTLATDVLPNDLTYQTKQENSIGLLMVVLITVAIIISTVIMLIACTQLCPCRERFKNVDEEGYFPNLDFPVPPRDVDLGLYPPVEGTPESIVSFEPLPDVPTIMKQRKLLRSNVARLRPKVSHVVRDRMDSEEDADALYRDTVQSKLDQLIASNTKQNFSRNQLNYIKELGSGWFGKVLQGDGQNILPGHKKTAAIIQKLREDADKVDQYAFLQESAPYRDTEHPNVLKLLGHCVETMPFLTVLELCINGDLKMYLRSQRPNAEIIDKQGHLLNFACDMAAGLQAMHQQNYVHRDFALRNCLVTPELTVKIGDYGLSEELYKEDYYLDPSGALIPIRWLAPEVIDCSGTNGFILRHITKDCNLWSFGVALWELVTFAGLPYAELSNEQVLKLVAYEQSIHLQRPEVPVSNLHLLYQLMELCWLTPAQRPSLRELRIMLLHLQSSKDELETSSFDKKWNQLLPRHHVEIHNSIATIDTRDITVLPQDEDDEFYHSGMINGMTSEHHLQTLPVFHKTNPIRSSNVNSQFTELDPTLLVHSTEFPSSFLSWTKFNSDTDNLSYLHLKPQPQLFPANELSLEAELGAESFSMFNRKNEEEEYTENKEFVFVSSPVVVKSSQSSDIEQSSKNAEQTKLSTHSIHLVAEVHRDSADPKDESSIKPLLEINDGNGSLSSHDEISASGMTLSDKTNHNPEMINAKDNNNVVGIENQTAAPQKQSNEHLLVQDQIKT